MVYGRLLTSLTLVATLVVGCSGEDAPTPRTTTVARATVSEVVEAPGTVAARATATVSAPADGRVAEIAVAQGQSVTTGTVLLRIDSPQAQAQLTQAEKADAQAAEAGAVTLPSSGAGPGSPQAREARQAAQKAFDRARESAHAIPLPEAQAQALAAVDAAQAQYAAAQAQADDAVRRFDEGLDSLATALASIGDAQRIQTQVAVDAARRRVEALTVVAPIDGVVSLGAGGAAEPGGAGDLLSQLPPDLAGQAGPLLGGAGGAGGAPSVEGTLSVGSPVGSGDVLASVTDVSTLTLVVDVDETDVLLVSPGVAAEADLDAVPGAQYPATVESIDVSPTASSGGGVSYRVRLSLGAGVGADGDPGPVPRPGMSAVVGLQVRTAEDVLAVPAAAVFRDGQRDAVWLVEDGVATLRPVVVGAEGAEALEVRDGLAEGDRVVVGGADQVSEGQSIP